VGRKIYISGKVTGDPGYKAKFTAEADRLRALGYRPVNPMAQISADEPWPNAMRIALGAMLTCDGVSLLPDWRESRGAKVEERLARELEMDVRNSGEWNGESKQFEKQDDRTGQNRHERTVPGTRKGTNGNIRWVRQRG